MVSLLRASAIRYIVDVFIVLAAGYELWVQLGPDYLIVAIVIAVGVGVGVDRLIALIQNRERSRIPISSPEEVAEQPLGGEAGDSEFLPPPDIHKPERKTRTASLEPRRSGQVCSPGPYVVQPGAIKEISLDIKKGERMKGRLYSTDGQDFDWEIVDWIGSVNARGGENYDYIEGEEGVAATAIDKRKNDSDAWYLLLRLPRRQNERRIQVELERTS